MLDKEPLGWGSSSRNGGMVIPELKAGPATLGKEVRRRWVGACTTRSTCVRLRGGDHGRQRDGLGGIDCDWCEAGPALPGAHADATSTSFGNWPRSWPLPASPFVSWSVVTWARDRQRCLLRRDGDGANRSGAPRQAPQRCGSPSDGCRRAHGARSHRALWGSPAPEIDHRVGHHPGQSGEARSRPDRHQRGRRRRRAVAARPVCCPSASFIIATEVLTRGPGPRRSAPTGRMMVDTKNLSDYWRLTPDGRMAFGGRRSLDPVEVAEARDFLYDSMLRDPPAARGVSQWSSPGAATWPMTLDRLPHVGRIDGAWYATGCNGSGVALNTWLGHRLGLVDARGGRAPAFAELPFARSRCDPGATPTFRWSAAGSRSRTAARSLCRFSCCVVVCRGLPRRCLTRGLVVERMFLGEDNRDAEQPDGPLRTVVTRSWRSTGCGCSSSGRTSV